jgi:hypothetical protein
MFSQLAQQNKELRLLHRSEREIDRSVDRRSAFGDGLITPDSMTDSYLLW